MFPIHHSSESNLWAKQITSVPICLCIHHFKTYQRVLEHSFAENILMMAKLCLIKELERKKKKELS